MSSLHTPRLERKSILLSRKSTLPYSDLSRVNSRYQSEILNGTREDPIEAALRELDAKHQSRMKQELQQQKEQEARTDSRSAKNRRKHKKNSSYDIKLSINDGMMKSEQERKEKLAHEIQRKKDRRNEFHQRKPSSHSSRRAAILTKKTAPIAVETNEMEQLQEIEFDGFVESYLRASYSHDENEDDVLDLSSLNTDEQTNIQNMEKLREDLKLVYNQYFGDTAILEFQAKFKQCSVLLERYPNDQDLPSELQTPRSLYLREVAKSKLLPLPLVLRSDKDPLAINLSHRGLGDKRILPIIKVMEKLPSVHTVDLSDNRLTDITLMPLATKLINLPNLTYLDLSFNKMDDSSETIMDYLKSKDCKLKTLKLDGADVDDNECVNLAIAITQNTSLRTLSLSRNLIGKSELLNVVHPDLTTGGEALGDMLKINKTLTKLDLSWNSIRLDSAIALALSLEANHTLKTLLLGYNSFGDMPCQILGTVLKANKGLTELDIESNSLTPKAATVLANAISFNETLLKLNINGNTLGKIGAQALVAAIQRSSTEDRKLQVSFVNCDCNIDDNNIFSAANPHGTWRMNLKEPYGQMVASECLYLANHKAGCRIVRLFHNGQLITLERSYVATAEEGEAGLQKKFKLDEFYKNSKSAAIELLANNFEEASKYLNNLLLQFGFFMDEEQRLTVIKKTSELWKIKAKREGRDDLHEVFLYEIFFSLFVLNDADLSGTMELDEFLTTLDSLGKKDFDREAAKRLMGEYDRDESGSIDANEFGTIMLTEFCRTEIPRGELVDVSTGKPWEIPTSGTCVIQLSYQCDVPTLFDIGADHGIDNIIESIRDAKTDDQREILFQNTTSSPYFFLSFDQAQLLFEEMQGLNRMPLELMASILPQIVNEEQAIKFIETNLNDIGKFALRLKIGHMYGAFVGLPTGHYYVDFKLPYQKNGARRLGAISVTEGKLCRQSGCVSSQKGNYSNFRNEKLGGIPVDVNARWFTSASNSGTTTGKILHCDYVSTQKPRKNTAPMSGQRFDKLIEQLKLDEIKRVWDRIQLVESRFFDRLSNTQNGQVGSFINPGHPDYHGLTEIENSRQSISSIIRKARASIEKESQPTVIAPPISHIRDAVVGMSPLQTNSGCPIDFHSFPELIMESPYTVSLLSFIFSFDILFICFDL